MRTLRGRIAKDVAIGVGAPMVALIAFGIIGLAVAAAGAAAYFIYKYFRQRYPGKDRYQADHGEPTA